MDWLRALMDEASRNLIAAVDALVPPPPPQLSGACATVQSFASDMALWGFLVPWEALAVAIGIVVGAIAAAIAIRVLRIGASVVTGGGGA